VTSSSETASCARKTIWVQHDALIAQVKPKVGGKETFGLIQGGRTIRRREGFRAPLSEAGCSMPK